MSRFGLALKRLCDAIHELKCPLCKENTAWAKARQRR